MRQVVQLLLLLIFVTGTSYAQKPPVKFGKIDIEDLKMTTYEQDTSATAVVLCKYGRFNANDLKFTLLKRVKILKKAGTEYSEFTFPGNEDVMVRGKIYNLENGEINEERLRNESIFKEKVTDDYYRIRVALPNIKVGSIYDIEVTQTLLPSEFAFQEDIPVLHSELRLEESTYINFRKRKVGYGLLTSPKNNTYIAQNVPAFKKEPFMNSPENYKTKFEFDILNISFPGYYKSYTTTWEAVNDRLSANVYFGGAVFNGAGYLSKAKKEIEANYNTDLDKLKAAYEYIKQIQWNEYESVWTSTTSLGSAFKEGKANSADINLMLLQLLMKLDIQALPVVLSTRDNGMLHLFYPSFDKLNYVIVWAQIGEKEYLMDATENLLPVGLLPDRCLNQHGRLVTNKSGKWIDLKTDKKDKDVILYNLTISDDLKLNGKIDYCKYDYSAFHFRKEYQQYASEEEYLIDLENENQGMRVKEFQLIDLDSLDKPVKASLEVSIGNKIQEINDLLLINPFLFEQMTNNPFKLENRQFPVDFTYKREKYLISKITIPENYNISELPEPIHAKLPKNGASVLINFQGSGNTVTVTYRLKIDKPIFSPEEYEYLKSLYAAIIAKHAEPIVLKRNNDAASL